MLKKSRVYFYLLISFLICFFNFLTEIENNSIQEAIFETVIIFPFIMLLLGGVYLTRKFLVKREYFSERFESDSKACKKNLIQVIVLKILLATFLIKALGELLFNDDADSVFFDVIFFAVLAASTVAVLLVYFLENFISTVENKHHIELQLSRHEKEKVIAKYLSLRRQLNPHFLFNSFNGLISLISIDQRKAENFVEELSNIYRYNLSQADEVVVSLRKELKMIASYVVLQQIRFSGALVYKEEVKEEYKDFLVPPMSLQLLVENAIKHNRVETKNPLVIKIFIEADYVVVQNNLQLRNKGNGARESFGIGIQNLKKQLEVIQSRKPIFEVENEHYTVKIPMIKNEIDD